MYFKGLEFTSASLIFCFAMVACCLFGGVSHYSPVPYYDTWDGAIDFFIRVSRGDLSAWWYQHNEHRIFFSRILFWMDLKWFHGRAIFLILMNYILVFAGVFLFWKLLLLKRKESSSEDKVLTSAGCILTAWLFLWCQRDNLTWAFQSQFFLAQLFPLIAFYLFYQSLIKPKEFHLFVWACFFGFCSGFTMANGVLALPLLTFYSLLYQPKSKRTWFLALLSLGVLALYFHDYESVDGHGSVHESFFRTPLQTLQYVCVYLGSPFSFLVGKGVIGQYVALFPGALMVIVTLKKQWQLLKNREVANLDFMLGFYLLFLFATALVTAGGRVRFGVGQAASERYTTPALMAWAAFFISNYQKMVSVFWNAQQRKIRPALWILLLLMVFKQLGAVYRPRFGVSDRDAAAMALELQVDDEEMIRVIYPYPKRAREVSKKALEQKISVFGLAPWAGAGEKMGTLETYNFDEARCFTDGMETISLSDPQFVRIQKKKSKVPLETKNPLLKVLNRDGKIVGYGVTDKSFGDCYLYVAKAALSESLVLKAQEKTCLFQ